MNVRFALLVTVVGLSAVSAAEESVVGSYTTVSESECNLVISLLADGKGSWVQSCGAEHGSPNGSRVSKDILWHMDGGRINVSLDGKAILFTIKTSLSCSSFGNQGSSYGLVGYNTAFWKEPVACK